MQGRRETFEKNIKETGGEGKNVRERESTYKN